MIATPHRRQRQRLVARLAKAGWLAAIAAALAGVFMLYTRPAFMVTMIDQLWACF